MSHPSRYFADDKDIYDLLMANGKRFGNDSLTKFLRHRGVVVSPLTERTQLVEYVARLPLGFRDIAELIDHLGSVSRRTPRTSSEKVSATIEEFQSAAGAVSDERSARRGEKFRITAREDGGLDIRVEYTLIDTKRNRMSQRSEMKLRLSIEPGVGAVRIRYPEDERSREIAEAIILKALGEPKETLREKISLAGCDAEQRTRFFESLFSSMTGFSLRTVTRTSFRRHDDDTPDRDLDGDNDEADLPGSIHDESGVRILRVQLDGSGIFESEQFAGLKKSGFYACGAVWRARQDGGLGVDAEFDANFVVTDSQEAFSYKLRGVFRRDPGGEHTKTRESPSEAERIAFLRALEDAATAAMLLVRGENAVADHPDELGEPELQTPIA